MYLGLLGNLVCISPNPAPQVMRRPVARYHGRARAGNDWTVRYKPLEIEGCELWYSFRSDSSGTDWGYKSRRALALIITL